jgi:hypothetical protein
MSSECCESQREMYVSMCIENIQRDSAAYHSICLLQTILITYPGQQVKQSWNTGGATASSKMKTKLPKINDYIPLLESRFNLLGLLLTEFNRFKSRYGASGRPLTSSSEVKRPVSSPSSASSTGASNSIFSMNVVAGLPSSYDKQIDARLKLLEYLFISCSQLMINRPSLLALWDLVVENAYSLIERQTALNWFYRLATAKINGRDVIGFDRDTAIALFQERMCRIPVCVQSMNRYSVLFV